MSRIVLRGSGGPCATSPEEFRWNGTRIGFDRHSARRPSKESSSGLVVGGTLMLHGAHRKIRQIRVIRVPAFVAVAVALVQAEPPSAIRALALPLRGSSPDLHLITGMATLTAKRSLGGEH